MNKREELIQKYVKDLKEKFGITPDLELLTKVTIGCGPSIYNSDSSTVSSSDLSELERVKSNFLIKKLGLSENDNLDEGLLSVIDKYGKSNRTKYRVVVYYLLTKYYNKEAVYSA